MPCACAGYYAQVWWIIRANRIARAHLERGLAEMTQVHPIWLHCPQEFIDTPAWQLMENGHAALDIVWEQVVLTG